MTATLDATFAVARHLANEWGDYGYTLSITGDGMRGAIATCRHTDGSEFTIHADRYGNLMGDD